MELRKKNNYNIKTYNENWCYTEIERMNINSKKKGKFMLSIISFGKFLVI